MTPDPIDRILRDSHVVAVVGASDDPMRPSFSVSRYIQTAGYRMIPVNPNLAELHRVPCYPSLPKIPEPIDVVVVFRRIDAVPAVVDEAIAVKARTVWMQSGVIHQEAARKARQAGLEVVMDRCFRTEHQIRFGPRSCGPSL